MGKVICLFTRQEIKEPDAIELRKRPAKSQAATGRSRKAGENEFKLLASLEKLERKART